MRGVAAGVLLVLSVAAMAQTAATEPRTSAAAGASGPRHDNELDTDSGGAVYVGGMFELSAGG